MKVQIEFDTTTATAESYRVLTRLAAALSDADYVPTAEVSTPEPQAESKPAPAKKAATKKVAPKPEPTPEPEDEVVEAEIVEEPEENLMELAVQKATKMVSDNRAPEVKAALEKAGARRVSELDGDEAIRTFLEALS